MRKFFATCPRGMEDLLHDELKQLGAAGLRRAPAGVAFEGELEIGYRSVLWSRFASRIVLSLADFRAPDDLSLYLGALNVPWEELFAPSRTIAVDFTGTSGEIRNTLYGARKIKDAVVDRFVKRSLPRPSVDTAEPDVRITAHLDRKGRLSLGLDLSGEALHRRAYRLEAGEAPLKENLAAAVAARADLNREMVADPMCGSGTLLIEAAMIMTDTAPGLRRTRNAFSFLSFHDEALWQKLLEEAASRSAAGMAALRERGVLFYGFDADRHAVETARKNALRAGFMEFMTFQECPLEKLVCPEKGRSFALITNPPYGERLGSFAELLELYARLGERLRHEFPGSSAAVISSSQELLGSTRLKAEKEYHLFNGAIPCFLRIYQVHDRSPEELIPGQESSADAGSGEPGDGCAGQRSPGGAGSGTAAPAGDGAAAPQAASRNESDGTLSREAQEFANRLAKNVRTLRKMVDREGLEAYRIYDADLPNYNAAVDVYGSFAVIQEYRAPASVNEAVARRRLMDMIRIVRSTLEIPGDNVIVKSRLRQRGAAQYEKRAEQGRKAVITEYGVRYLVRLEDYLDTGLFADHRLVRRLIGQSVRDRDFLNLFAYTATASVQAVLGGARTVTSVDMSRTYLDWARENMALNGIEPGDPRCVFVREDCLAWLDQTRSTYDWIYVDPPTFSNSKRMEETFDVERDQVALLTRIRRILRPGGTVLFSNNRRNFRLKAEPLAELGFGIRDLSRQTLCRDYASSASQHHCWLLTLGEDHS